VDSELYDYCPNDHVLEVVVEVHHLQTGRVLRLLSRCTVAQIFFVEVRAREIEVQLIGVDFGEEIAMAREVFQIEKFIFFEARHSLHIALVCAVGGMRIC